MNFYIAAIVGTIASFVVGCLWYSILFGTVWQKSMNCSDEKIKEIFVPKKIALAFVSEWIATACLTGLLYASETPMITFVQIACILVFAGIKLAVFDGKSFKTILINHGYTILSVTIIYLSFILIVR